MGRFKFLYVPIVMLVCLIFTSQAHADTISGTVKDSSGGVVIGARIEITGGNLSQPLLLVSDESGKFTAPNLNAGKYTLHVSKEGFDVLVATIELQDKAELSLKLAVVAQQTSITVNEKSLAFANSDSIYRQLRDDGLGETYRCENITLPMDVGTFELKSGTITFLAMVDKYETGAVFVGRGHFTLKPLLPLDINEMTRRSGNATAEEDFTEVVFRFSPDQFSEFAAVMGTKTDAGGGLQRLSALER